MKEKGTMKMTAEAKREIEPIKAAILANFLDVCPDQARYAEVAAAAGFRDIVPNQLNCAQTVLRFALWVLGHDPGLVAAVRYCGAGVVRTGHICGALSGAVLALGVRDYYLGEQWADATVAADEEHAAPKTGEGSHLRSDEALADNVEKLQQMFRDFEEKFGGTTCRQLTGYDFGNIEEYNRFRYDDISLRCQDYVAWAMDRVCEML